MRTVNILRAAAVLTICSLFSTANAQSSGNVIKIGVVGDLSGASAERGVKIVARYKEYADKINADGGLSIASNKYKIDLDIRDARSDEASALAEASRLISQDKVEVLLCSHVACIKTAEETQIPLLLTAGGTKLSRQEKSTFLINAPSAQDFDTQTTLAIAALNEALVRSGNPKADKITDAFRSLKIKRAVGSVRFDKSGNNSGRVTYTMRPDIQPNAAGCTNSCASTCPTDCGQTQCTKSGDNQCCNVCGKETPD